MVSDKEQLKKIRDFFKPSPRGRLGFERFISGRWLLSFLFIIGLLVAMIILALIINFLESIQDLNILISVVIPIILGFQLIFLLFQVVFQHINTKYSKIAHVPRFSIKREIETTKTRRGKIKDTGKVYLILINKGTDAHNTSFAIRINKNWVRSKIPLFLFPENTKMKIYSTSKEEFNNNRIDVYVRFEDMVNILRNAHFRKDVNSTAFRTVLTGL